MPAAMKSAAAAAKGRAQRRKMEAAVAADGFVLQPRGELPVEGIPVDQRNAVAPFVEHFLHIVLVFVKLAGVGIVHEFLFQGLCGWRYPGSRRRTG